MMPPKRKNKATKAPAATQLKAPPANAVSHAKRKGSPGPGAPKPSRLLPSEPLHMKTRRAVKTASNQGSDALSSAGSSSRRSSLNDLAHFQNGESDMEHERPAKRNRLSPDSGSPRLSTDASADQTMVNGAHASESSNLSMRDAADTADGVKASPRKRRASDGSSESSKTVGASRANGVLTRPQSEPSRKKRRTTTHTSPDSADPPELTDASTAPNSPEQIPEVGSSQNLHHVLPTNGDAPAKMGRRLPGRRRAPHADINVEIDLRRQLNLKMSYRSLAKIQKNILEELSTRTTTNLDNDPQFHKQCPEYGPLMAALDQYKENRIKQIEALRREKLDQLERVHAAELRIANEKRIQRFYDLQEDLLYQCFYRAKQLQREWRKREDGAGTEDEDNILPPTRFAFPPLDADDRVGSKYASRSRAYVETERLLDDELNKKRFGQTLKDFIAQDEEADHSIIDAPSGFAAFIGPDRIEAVAHNNIINLIDAANDVESTPVRPSTPKVIPNEQANALFMLASLSADQACGSITAKDQPTGSIASISTGGTQTGTSRTKSPLVPSKQSPTAALSPMRMDIDDDSTPVHQSQDVVSPKKARYESNGICTGKEQVVPTKETPVRSTHRIMDMLNNDADIPLGKSQYTSADGSASTNQGVTPIRTGMIGLSAIMHPNDVHPEKSTFKIKAEPLHSREIYSSPVPSRVWPEAAPKPPTRVRSMTLEELRAKDPLHKLLNMLNSKNNPDAKISPNQRSNGQGNAEQERVQTTAPSLLSQPFNHSGALENMDQSKEPRRPSSAYNASPPTASLPYKQSPSAAPAYLARQSSQDAASSQWERDRRLSGSQAPRPPVPQTFASSPPQSKTVPPHQTPLPAPSIPSGPQLPSISTLSPKPSGPINFRFAHYDPVPPRSAYKSPQSSYSSSSHQPSHGPPPQQYHSSMSGPSYQGGYVPPPGSFRAPPPPPPPPTTTSTEASTPYPPLKIHQYGGQPILPANMAPSQSHTQSPSMTFIGQTAPLSAYSPPPQHPLPQHNASYDATVPREPSSEGLSEPGSGSIRQPRRAYRSYHAPGSQFRPYNGPDSARRRGG